MGVSAGPPVDDRLVSWWASLPRRSPESVTTVVLHATEIPTLDEAWDYAERSADGSADGTGVCGHLYIDRDGGCHLFVPLDRVAAHAAGHNTPSIGIELVNTGRHPDHFHSRAQVPAEDFPAEQTDALLALLDVLKETHPNLVHLVRHSDLDQRTVPASDDPAVPVRRRIDPGPRFPWTRVRRHWERPVSGHTG
ncbi:N-acetylmuramoyl-L-alanine amidase [Actinomadura opuntiae]|uniref:N-acetylmuramoyl-L-alanine amidase n=1 Tax=Actinomadura sp. OS1-43 TaxID=604315 RepID=UPI00255B1704|nr:N-acetylmuramoyl-L-alanine amidase [Actinomadura sp. OS1-43]MDL4819343.1 N-acetylmuramoyl-L-alanine amidase [Actinomadura sp. OS1-43]